MSAAEALKTARAAGIQIGIDGDDLLLGASAPPRAAVLDLLSRHKAGIVRLLRSERDGGWSAEAWQVFFDERTGTAEFDGRLPRTRAKARAFACCVAAWLIRNPVRSPPGRCLGCGGGDAHEPMLPFGSDPTGHAWLHSRCWPDWHAGRKAEAVIALAAMGITTPPDFPDDFGKNGGA